MKSDAKIIDLLNQLLTNELTAINQYFIHAKMLQDWGYKHLYEKVRAESIDEMKHADEVIERILFLDGVPNMQRLGQVKVGESVKEQLELDLAFEYDAIKFLNGAAETVRSMGDHTTFLLMARILEGEEDHVDWLESQLELIAQTGLENYLAQQIRD